MKTWKKTLLIVALVFVFAISGLCIWQWNNLKAAHSAATKDAEALGQELEQVRNDFQEDFAGQNQVEINLPTFEQTDGLLTGTIDPEELKELLGLTQSSDSKDPSIGTDMPSAQQPSDSPSDSSGDTPAQQPSDSPSDSTNDTPAQQPSDFPSDSTNDTPAQQPSDSPSDSTNDTPAQQPSDFPSDSTNDTPAQQPSDTPSDSTSDTPAQQPSDSPSDSSNDTPAQQPSDSPSNGTNDTPAQQPLDSPSDPSDDTTPEDPSAPTAQELVDRCVAELTLCEIDLMARLGQIRQAALAEWSALSEEERTTSNKMQIGMSILSQCYALESSVDAQVGSIIGQYQGELAAIGADPSVLDSLWDYYVAEKEAQKAYYLSQLTG